MPEAGGKPPLKLIVHFSVGGRGEIFVGDSRHPLISSDKADGVIVFLAGFQKARPDTIFEFSTEYEITENHSGFVVATELTESQTQEGDSAMEIYAVVFEDNPKELVNSDSLFDDNGKAVDACIRWNADIPACASRSAIVMIWTVK